MFFLLYLHHLEEGQAILWLFQTVSSMYFFFPSELYYLILAEVITGFM